jgi:hypothetical protein
VGLQSAGIPVLRQNFEQIVVTDKEEPREGESLILKESCKTLFNVIQRIRKLLETIKDVVNLNDLKHAFISRGPGHDVLPRLEVRVKETESGWGGGVGDGCG